ncbi:Holliday junction resolvase RuvX [bacterium]|nr:Holliday junction resolvase RuvX [bacterium]
MYILGIDFGTKKLGIAILEDSSEIISPLPLVKNDQFLWQSLGKIIADYRLQHVIIGLPSYENTAKKVKTFTETLQKRFSVTTTYVNEDNTSLSIKKDLITHKQQQNLDSYSAIAILEQWLTQTR